MDRIIKITLGLFIVILVLFVGTFTYTGYIENSYRSSLASTYTYTCTISTDSPLYNVTLFIPVPSDKTGNSAIVKQFFASGIQGIPATWKTSVLGSEKVTMVEIVTPSIIPPAGTSAKNPYTVTFGTELNTKGPIDTVTPIASSAMFRPVLDPVTTSCRAGSPQGASCYSYRTSVYADYVTSPNAEVKFTTSLTGRNSWKIFEPKSNEYRTDVSLTMTGATRKWILAQGYLESGIGANDAPLITS